MRILRDIMIFVPRELLGRESVLWRAGMVRRELDLRR